MAKYYHLTTNNYLPQYKSVFKTQEAALEKLKEIVDLREEWVHNKYLHRSYHMVSFDPDELPEYKKIFKENVSMNPPERPTISEQGLRKPKKNASK